MSTKISVNKQSLRRSSLALHRMNSSRKGGGLGMAGGNGGAAGHEGFEDLRQFVKQGGEFAKELSQTLAERAELESSYAKGLAKLSAKLFKSVRDLDGTVSNSWHFIAEDMEATAETHRSMSAVMTEDLVKPLRMFSEQQHRARKSAEAHVEKRARALGDWRAQGAKAKAKCFGACRDHEKVMDQVLDCKLGRGRVLGEKELLKLEGKRKKSEAAVRKADLDYYTATLRTERSR